MSQTTVQTMRKAAILVASLSEWEGQQLTSGLSASDADSLHQAVDELGPIDPRERQEVLQELRLGSSHALTSLKGGVGLEKRVTMEEGVELDWSPTSKEKQSVRNLSNTDPSDTHSPRLPDMHSSTPRDSNRSATSRSRPFDLLGSHETEAMAEKLLDEPPQIIAVVMSQLTTDLAAELLQEMPLTLQADVLERLAQLHPADRQSLHVVEDHLADWLESHRQREQQLSLGNEKVRQILARTSGPRRKEILDRLGHQSPVELNRTAEPSPTKNITIPMERPSKSEFTPGDTTTDASSTQVKGSPNHQNPCDLVALDQVSDAMLLEALRKTEPQIAMLALAGAPPHLLDRILGQLPRRQAKQFRRQLHSLQPTRMSDLLAAQQRFAQLAMGGGKCEV